MVKKGFTIVELLIVVVVIAILAAIVIVSYNGISNYAHDSNVQSSLNSIQKKLLTLDTTGERPDADISGQHFTGATPASDAIAQQLKPLVPTSADSGTRYAAMLRMYVDEDSYYNNETNKYEPSNQVVYGMYVRSQSKKVFVLTNEGMVRNLSAGDQRESYIEHLNEEAEGLTADIAFNAILWRATSATDAAVIADCQEFRTGQYPDDPERAEYWVIEGCANAVAEAYPFHSSGGILSSPDPVQACIAYYLGTPSSDDDWHATDGYCAEWEVQYHQRLQAQPSKLLAIQSNIDTLSNAEMDAWDVNMYERNGVQYFTSTMPFHSEYSSGIWYAYDTQTREWVRVISGNYRPMS